MILNTTYFGSVDWYRQIACAKDDVVYIEAHENYVKQTERNRCYIATANGKQALSVPVSLPSHQYGIKGSDPLISLLVRNKITDVLVSDHGNWRHNHWEALKTAYGMSPFFEYYKDDIRPFFKTPHPNPLLKERELLFDYNLAIAKKMLELLGIKKKLQQTDSYQEPHPFPPLEGREISPYYQTFQRRNGFIPGLSILDLLFNEGPEAMKYLTSF